MASLTDKNIKDTYKGLLKTADNAEITSQVEVTDGDGNQTGVYLNTDGSLKASGTLEFGSLKDSGEDITITKFVDEADGIAGNDNDTTIPTSAAVKDYVDTNVTAQDLDFVGDSGIGSVDLDSQNLDIAGGTGITTSALDQTLTIDIDSTVATLSDTQTLTNKSIDLTDNTISGTTAEFNAALSDNDFATLAGSETLTNKGIDADNNTISNLEVDNLKAGVLDTDLSSVSASDDTLASAKAIKTYVDAAITAEDLDFSGDTGSGSIDLDSEVLSITGSGIATTSVPTDNNLQINVPATNLSNTPSASTLDVESSTGTNTTLPAATTSLAGVMSSADKTKLDGIEAGAEVNPTASEIKTAYESNSDTNAFTDAEKSKLSGIESGAEVNDVTSVNTQIGAVVLDADDIDDTATTNKFTTASDISKLAGIEAGADVTDSANVTTALSSISVTAHSDVTSAGSGEIITSAERTKLSGIEAGAEVNTVDSVNAQTGAVVLDADDISDATTTNKWATSAEKTKLGHISVTQAVDLDTMESDISTNAGNISTNTTAIAGKVSKSGDTMTGDLTLDNSKLTINKTSDGVLLGDAAAKRMQWVNPNYITAHSEDPTSAGTYRKSFDFDGDYLGGGYAGVYETRTGRSGVSIHAASYINASGHSANQMKVYPPLTGGSTILLESKDLGSDASRFSGIEINDSRTPTGYPANRFRLNASFTDEATIPFYVNGDAKINGDLTMGTNSIFIGGTGAANEFDDYEEGTFDLTLAIGQFGGLTDYTIDDFGGSTKSATAKYVKIGRFVYCTGYMQFDSVPTAWATSGTMQYVFLRTPFTMSTSNLAGGGTWGGNNNKSTNLNSKVLFPYYYGYAGNCLSFETNQAAVVTDFRPIYPYEWCGGSVPSNPKRVQFSFQFYTDN